MGEVAGDGRELARAVGRWLGDGGELTDGMDGIDDMDMPASGDVITAGVLATGLADGGASGLATGTVGAALTAFARWASDCPPHAAASKARAANPPAGAPALIERSPSRGRSLA